MSSYCREPFYKIIVPTVDTVRYEYLVSKLLQDNHPVLMVGNVGTGKTSTAVSVMEACDKTKFTVLSINISAQVNETIFYEKSFTFTINQLFTKTIADLSGWSTRIH